MVGSVGNPNLSLTCAACSLALIIDKLVVLITGFLILLDYRSAALGDVIGYKTGCQVIVISTVNEVAVAVSIKLEEYVTELTGVGNLGECVSVYYLMRSLLADSLVTKFKSRVK